MTHFATAFTLLICNLAVFSLFKRDKKEALSVSFSQAIALLGHWIVTH
jgi:uncharacterized membrane protein YsdA (DUF1294 family)